MYYDRVNLKLQSNWYIKGTEGTLKMCPLSAGALYIQVQIVCVIHYTKKMKLPFIDSDLLNVYTGAL